MDINWAQVLIAFFLGVFTSAMAKGLISKLPGGSKIAGLGG